MDWLNRYTTFDHELYRTDVVHRGDGRAVVTDARCILAVDDPGATLAELNMGSVRLTAKVRESLGEPAPAGAPAADLADLWLWLDRIERTRCNDCAGSGVYGGREWNDPPPCEECEGKGWLHPDPHDFDSDTVSLLGLPLDRNRLAWWLAGELEPHGRTVRFWVAESFRRTKLQVVALDAGGWRLLVASLHPDGREGRRYREYFPGAGLWWQHRRCRVSRLTALDWCQDNGVEADEVSLFGGVV